ncbi:hypothetical protein BU14_0143s0011 [Porphyra umbilicalis]|uniref:Uncharacterized protein n=1 Tax=Porphyra umbilicalis TaxID=2786 RepID=A0A1X6PA16_PORUM|nr:hypothetical protein BU14_0143s0011 [Porphyra umbilicalis]|eukprot:OSX77575.1 hypothetical protein BU14_0143s0011 [Porphyra umbilicalis]
MTATAGARSTVCRRWGRTGVAIVAADTAAGVVARPPPPARGAAQRHAAAHPTARTARGRGGRDAAGAGHADAAETGGHRPPTAATRRHTAPANAVEGARPWWRPTPTAAGSVRPLASRATLPINAGATVTLAQPPVGRPPLPTGATAAAVAARGRPPRGGGRQRGGGLQTRRRSPTRWRHRRGAARHPRRHPPWRSLPTRQRRRRRRQERRRPCPPRAPRAATRAVATGRGARCGAGVPAAAASAGGADTPQPVKTPSR